MRIVSPLGIVLVLLAAADARAIQSLCETGNPLGEVTARFSKFIPSSDRERFRVAARVPTAGGSIDPVATGVRVMLAAAVTGVLLDETVPPGAYDATTRTGWHVGSGRWRFSRPGRVPNGIKRVTVTMAPGTTSVVVEADGGAVAFASPLEFPPVGPGGDALALSMDVAPGAGGICATRTFAGAAPCLTRRGVAYGNASGPVTCRAAD